MDSLNAAGSRISGDFSKLDLGLQKVSTETTEAAGDTSSVQNLEKKVTEQTGKTTSAEQTSPLEQKKTDFTSKCILRMLTGGASEDDKTMYNLKGSLSGLKKAAEKQLSTVQFKLTAVEIQIDSLTGRKLNSAQKTELQGLQKQQRELNADVKSLTQVIRESDKSKKTLAENPESVKDLNKLTGKVNAAVQGTGLEYFLDPYKSQ